MLGLITLTAMLLAALKFPRAPIALVGMLGATLAVWAFDLEDRGVLLVGAIPAGIPAPGLPEVSLDDVLALLGPALGVAFVGYTDNILTGRAFAARRGERIDAKRELLALGAANLGSGLLHGFPVSSSGSRTAIGDAVGGRTQLASLVTVLCTVAALLFARPVLAAFPRRRSARSSCTPPSAWSTSASSSASPGSAAASSCWPPGPRRPSSWSVS